MDHRSAEVDQIQHKIYPTLITERPKDLFPTHSLVQTQTHTS